MKISALRLILAIVGISLEAQAITIGINLGPTGVITSGPDPSNGSIMLSQSFADLDGTALGGQSLSLDLLFTGDEFIRIFSASPRTALGIEVGLTFYTDAGHFVGFFGPSAGYLIDANGAEFAAGAVGRCAGSDGSLGAGLFPGTLDGSSWSDDLAGRPYDFYGVHYDLVLPNDPNVQITAATFDVDMASVTPPILGVGPGIPADIVPDAGSTLVFMGLALAGLSAPRLFGRRGCAISRD